MRKIEQEMLAYYQARSTEYESIYYRDDAIRQQELADAEQSLVEAVRDKSVLEFACGTGYWTKAMSRVAKKILAVDYSTGMIEKAREKTYDCPVRFETGDMFTFSPGETAFDVVVLGFWFSHQSKDEYDRLFDVLTRPLKPGGRIWMIDNNPPAESSHPATPTSDEFGNNIKKRLLDDGTEFTIIKNYFSEESLQTVLTPRFRITGRFYGKYYWWVELEPLDKP